SVRRRSDGGGGVVLGDLARCGAEEQAVEAHPPGGDDGENAEGGGLGAGDRQGEQGDLLGGGVVDREKFADPGQAPFAEAEHPGGGRRADEEVEGGVEGGGPEGE